MKKNKTGIFLLCFFIVFGVVFLAYYFTQYGGQKKLLLPVYGNDRNQHVQPFSFVNQDGKVITDVDVKGKICLVEYFYATCKGICPKMNENMKLVFAAYKGSKDVVILSHTVDPVKDSVQALKSYSMRFGADGNQWMFLTGDKKKLYDMARYSYLLSTEDDTVGVSIKDDFIHDNHYSLVDRHGRIRGFYDGTNPVQVKKAIDDINTLLMEKE
jgi:protein SCO1/2